MTFDEARSELLKIVGEGHGVLEYRQDVWDGRIDRQECSVYTQAARKWFKAPNWRGALDMLRQHIGKPQPEAHIEAPEIGDAPEEGGAE